MRTRLTHRDLWRASWPALVRLARSLGLRVGDGAEGERRGPLVDGCQRRMTELELQDAARRGP